VPPLAGPAVLNSNTLAVCTTGSRHAEAAFSNSLASGESSSYGRGSGRGCLPALDSCPSPNNLSRKVEDSLCCLELAAASRAAPVNSRAA
jgi:hypothetical protein